MEEKKEYCMLCKVNEATMTILAKAQEGEGEANGLPVAQRICIKCFFKNL